VTCQGIIKQDSTYVRELIFVIASHVTEE